MEWQSIAVGAIVPTGLLLLKAGMAARAKSRGDEIKTASLIGRLEAVVESFESKLDSIRDTITARVDTIDKRFDKLEVAFDRRVSVLESDVESLYQRQIRHEAELAVRQRCALIVREGGKHG